ncbi:MAG: hypothetical protein ACKO2V_15765, partial [Snowella sp.]
MKTEIKGGLFEILAKIKAKPGLYLGSSSLSDLFIFLVGYKTARKELGIESTPAENKFYQEFHQFIETKYNLKTANSWAKIIMLYCSDERQGFERFFQLLDEFQSFKNGQKFLEISLEKDG